MATAKPVEVKHLKTTGPNIARVYLYTTKSNDTWITKEAKRRKISKSTLLDKLITDLRKGKIVSPEV